MSAKQQASAVAKDITPGQALQLLKEGNFRFVNRLQKNRDLLQMVNETKDGQWPFAAILSCMDSRTSAELIFNQGLGDIFSIRIAGNIVSEGILASLEYATAVAGSRIILVLGHTDCGAVKGACDNVKLGHLEGLLQKIRPAVESETTVAHERSSANRAFVDKVSHLNVRRSAEEILERSAVIRELVNNNQLMVASAMYDIANGMITFFNE
jgi:carbonic anhydrase